MIHSSSTNSRRGAYTHFGNFHVVKDNGLKWIGVQLGSPNQLAGLAPTAGDDGDVDICVFVPSSKMPGIDAELRCFFGVGAIREDR